LSRRNDGFLYFFLCYNFIMITFPKNFLWGAATSSYQVEGNNTNADWWEWEKRAGREPSGAACLHYERYEQDFDLAKNLNHNAHRLSIEWSRVEPAEGEFSQKEIQHYIDVILALRRRHIEPVVTLHHFTNPIWLAQQGSWVNKKAVERFVRYSDVVVRALAPYVRYWITINEPTIYLSHSFLFGTWPPQEKSYVKSKKVHDHLLWAHIDCYRRIHQIYKELSLPQPMVSLSHHMPAVVPCSPSLKNRLAAYVRDRLFNFEFLDKVVRQKAMDYIGLNYYSRQLVDLKHWGVGNMVWDICTHNHHPVKKNSLGWDIYPEGLYQVLTKLKRYNLPVVVTENGICTLNDDLRWEFIDVHLKAIHRAMQEGVDVAGYLYWSLLDNFEWAEGYKPRFGLIDMNYQTQERTIRPSARKFAAVCQSGILE
jgi:beta-glucosidase